MRRKLKVFLSVMIVLTLLVTSVCSVFATNGHNGNQQNFKKQFKDVGEDFWGYKAIQQLTQMGVINGFSDNTFKPNQAVTRSQFAQMLTTALDLTASGSTQTFADVPANSWDYKAVEASAKYLTGYKTSNGTLYFRGSQNAVREDMAVALVKALNITLSSDNGQLQSVFNDYNQISPSLKDYVYTAYKSGIMVGANCKFNPQGNLTRAEAATLLYIALQKTDKVPVDDSQSDQKVPVDGTTATTDATLSSLTYNGVSVPGFSSSKYTYNVTLAAGTTAIPVVAAAAHDSSANESITQASALPGYAQVLVIAEDGSTYKTYTVNFTVAQTELHKDATLSGIVVNGTVLTGFSSGKTSYNVTLQAGTTALPVVTATVHDAGKATAEFTQATALPGYAVIWVTAEDGITHKTYTVNFTVAPSAKSTDATLSGIAVNSTALASFNASTLVYNVQLAAGTTAIPAVTATVHDTGKATAVVTPASALPGYATILVTAEDGITHKTYFINFTVAPVVKDTDATLSSIGVNGTALASFNASTLVYNVQLPAGTTAIPVVTAVVHDTGKAAAVLTQAAALPGNASIVVTAEDGVTHKTYTVNFTVAPTLKSTDATLSDLDISGTTLAGFSPDQLTYDVFLSAGTQTAPAVTATLHDSKASLVITQASGLPGSATVVVTAEDGTTHKTYTINFTIS